MKNRNLFSILFMCSLLCLSVLIGCTNTPTVPGPVGASFQNGSHLYNCPLVPATATSEVFFGHGKIQMAVQGNNAPQFSQTTLYTQANMNAAQVTTQNGTQDLGINKIAGDCVYFQVPFTGGYTVTLRYNEGYTGCQAPFGQCWRWFKQLDVPSGTVPNCANTNYVYIINQQDPDGFTGPCL